MKQRTLWFCIGACTVLSACGSASVKYSPSLDSNTDASKILAAAAGGGQVVVLPNSRIVVVVTPPINSGAQDNGNNQLPDAGNAPAPPPNGAGPTPLPRAAPAAAPTHGGAIVARAPGGPAAPTPAKLPVQPAQQAQAQQQAGQNQAQPSKGPPPSSVTINLTAPDKTQYTVSVVQIESSVSFMVTATNDFFSSNDLSITRLANTRIPTTVSNTFTDETASRVKTIVSIASTVAGALVAPQVPSHGAPTPEKPITPACLSGDLVIDAAGEVSETSESGQPTSGARKWQSKKSDSDCLNIAIEATSLAPNLVPIAMLKNSLADKNASSDWSKVWPVPACMTVKVTIQPFNPEENTQSSPVATGQITLVDPDYVELLPIPKKGKIAMHPICSADLTDSTTDKYQDAFDTISAIDAALPAKSKSH